MTDAERPSTVALMTHSGDVSTIEHQCKSIRVITLCDVSGRPGRDFAGNPARQVSTPRRAGGHRLRVREIKTPRARRGNTACLSRSTTTRRPGCRRSSSCTGNSKPAKTAKNARPSGSARRSAPIPAGMADRFVVFPHSPGGSWTSDAERPRHGALLNWIKSPAASPSIRSRGRVTGRRARAAKGCGDWRHDFRTRFERLAPMSPTPQPTSSAAAQATDLGRPQQHGRVRRLRRQQRDGEQDQRRRGQRKTERLGRQPQPAQLLGQGLPAMRNLLSGFREDEGEMQNAECGIRNS